jgi:hypothetical protein
MKAKNKFKFYLFFVSAILIILIWNYRKIIKQKASILIYSFPNKKLCPCNNASLHLKFDNYQKIHVPKVKMYKQIKSHEELNEQINKGNLISISNGNGFKLRKFEYSSAYLHPKAFLILQELGNRFQQRTTELLGYEDFFEISSMLRTTEQQKNLAKQMSSATKGTSTHTFGLAFDIVALKSNRCAKSLIILEDLLNEMRSEGKIVLCPEKACIHVTVI